MAHLRDGFLLTLFLLHPRKPLINPGAVSTSMLRCYANELMRFIFQAGEKVVGGADVVMTMRIGRANGQFNMNGVPFNPPE